MRHKYETVGIVLSRLPAGETNAQITIITPDFGLVRARAQGVRKSGAKLATALATFSESGLSLVRGVEYWRITGAVLKENWFLRIKYADSRERATRVCGLLLRFVAGETRDHNIFHIVHDFFESLAILPHDKHGDAEILVVLRILASLGLDNGEIKDSEISKNRANYIARINRGIEASGL